MSAVRGGAARGVSWSLWLGLVIVAALTVRPAWAAEPPSVFFQELMWAGTDRSTADEWVVLRNRTARSIALDGWRLTSVGSSGESLVAALDGLTIAAHGALLIASHDQHHAFTNGESALALDPDLVASALTLSNSRLQLKLFAPGSATPTDVAGTGRAPLAGTTKPPTAMERVDPSLDGTLATSWTAATSQQHLDAGSTSLAAPDHAGRPAVITTSLGSLPATLRTSVSVVVTDPDGEDDVANVALSCPEGTISLGDAGLAGDERAGDRAYGGWLTVAASGQATCTATVTDRTGLARAQSLTRSAYVRTARVIVNELLPNPAGGEEWIELENLEATPVDLTSWQLDDRTGGGSRPLTLTDTIPAHGFLVLPADRSRLALNNDGDDVTLINPEGAVIDTTTYGSATAGRSWARVAGRWQWVSQPTPGGANLADPATPLAAPPPAVTVDGFSRLPAETIAQLTGRVVALPGTLSRRSWLLADTTGIAEIYLDHGSFATLELGQWVSVTGRRSGVRQPRLLLATGVTDPVVRPPETVVPERLADALATRSSRTSLVTGTLTLSRVNAKSLVASTSGRSITLVWSDLLPTTTFDEILVPGQTVTVTGLLTDAETDQPVVTLRSADDLVAGTAPLVASVASAGPEVTPPAAPVTSDQPTTPIPVARAIPVIANGVAAAVTHRAAAARLTAQLAWVRLATEVTALNQAIARELAGRAERRLTWWRAVDQSAIVALLGALVLLHFMLGWEFVGATTTDPPRWSGG